MQDAQNNYVAITVTAHYKTQSPHTHTDTLIGWMDRKLAKSIANPLSSILLCSRGK